MGENPLNVVSRITLAMFGVGVGIGLVALFTWEWIEALVMSDLGGEERQVVEGYTPLAFLLIASLSAPLVAGIVGIFEGLRTSTNRSVLIIGNWCSIILGPRKDRLVCNRLNDETGHGKDTKRPEQAG